jgi:hypothetical protein
MKLLKLLKEAAYQDASNNELALYLSILSKELSAAKTGGKEGLVKLLTQDIEEVKKELKSRNVSEDVQKVVKESSKGSLPSDVSTRVKQMYNSGEFSRIESSTRLKKGDDIFGMYSEVFFTIKNIVGDTITMLDESYGDEYKYKREDVELSFLVRKK